MGVGRARCAILAVAIALPAFAADPYPDQPGALTPQELRDATVAMESALGAEPKLPLVASGRRPTEHALAAYAVFAGTREVLSPFETLQPRLLCSISATNPKWTCRRHALYEALQRAQAFIYSVGRGESDSRAPAMIFRYLDSCFPEQYLKMTGVPYPYPGGVPVIAEVVKDAKRVRVTAGTGPVPDIFELEEAPSGPAHCGGYELFSAQAPKAAGPLPAPMADIQRRNEELSREEWGRRQREEKFRRTMDKLTDLCIWVNLLAAPLAILLPLARLLTRGRRAVVGISAVMGAVVLSSAAGVLVFLELAHIPDTGHSLLVVIPATFLALVACGIWIAVGLTAPAPVKA